MIAVSRSSRIAHSAPNDPTSSQRISTICCVMPSKVRKTIQLRKAARKTRPVVMTWPANSPIRRQPKPQISAPISGAKRTIVVIASALHHVDVFDVDGAPVAEEADEDRKADGRLR